MRQISIFLVCLFGFTLLETKDSIIFPEVLTTAQVVFSANREGNREIYIMNPDGTNQINLTQHNADDVCPSFSPTGKRIAFSSDRGNKAWGTWDLYLMDVDGTNVKKIFDTSAVRMCPTWSPDGKQIAYDYFERGQRFIYMGTIDGKNEERLAIGSSPAWSPNGMEIAFVSGAPEHKQINLLNLSSLKEKKIFPPEANPSWIGSIPTWAPTSDKISFSWLNRVPLADFVERETIYIVNRNGKGLVQVVDEAGPKAISPVWSPCGDMLLYQQWDEKVKTSSQIFRVTLDGGNPKQLTHIGWNSPGDWFDPNYALPVSLKRELLTTTWAKVKKK